MQALETRVFGTVARRMTRAEYDRLAAEGFYANERVELIHGIVVRMSPIGPSHADVTTRLTRLLVLALHDRADVRVQVSVVATDESEPEPDFAIVPRKSYAKEHPDTAFLVIEVADSSLDYDRETKASLYAATGIPEYWIVNLRAKTIEVHTNPVDAEYSSVERGRETASPRAFPDVVVNVADLFD